MNPGEKQILKTVMQTQQIIVGGETYEETVEVGSVVRARPGPRVDGPEYIVLVTQEQPYRWNAPLDDYDPDTVDDDPANEPRWEAV
jgi:hypothetical protein